MRSGSLVPEEHEYSMPVDIRVLTEMRLTKVGVPDYPLHRRSPRCPAPCVLTHTLKMEYPQ